MQAQLRQADVRLNHMNVGNTCSPAKSILQTPYTLVIISFHVWKN